MDMRQWLWTQELDVICDKPITNELDTALDLVERARSKGLVFCLTHNYSGYPMVREARAAIEAGEIGPLRVIHLSYVQGSLGSRVEEQPDEMSSRLKWRLDPARGGVSHVMGDIGTHAHQLLTFISGQRVEAVLADVGAALPGRTAHDTGAVILNSWAAHVALCLLRRRQRARKTRCWWRPMAKPAELAWQQASPNELRVMRNNKPAELRTRGLPTLYPLSRRATRLPPGHPEAFLEAFANVYADFADLVAARRTGRAPDPLASVTPDAIVGAEGLAFVDACIELTKTCTWANVRRVT